MTRHHFNGSSWSSSYHFDSASATHYLAQVNINLIALLSIQQRLVGRSNYAATGVPLPVRNLCAAAVGPSAQPKPSKTNPDALPHYPLPELELTLQKYLRSVKPLLSPEAFALTKKACCGFTGPLGEAPQLHEILRRRAAHSENWLADWWLKYAYLGYRDPVVLNSNPGLYYEVRCFGDADEWLSHAARTIWATMRFKEQIDAKEIHTNKPGAKGAKLDMAQFGKIFGTCRIPHKEFDKIEYNPCSTHVVVAYRNGVSFE